MPNYFERLDRCLIVAEIGVNHNGNIDLAKRMIAAAAESGADAVKFQTFITEENTSPNAETAVYQKEVGSGDSLYEMISQLELSLEDHCELKHHAEAVGVTFFSRAAGHRALRMLLEVGVPYIKVGSLDLNWHQLLADIAETGLPILLSTGAATLGEVEEALSVILRYGNHDLLLYHCTSNYPTAYNDVNLRAMLTLRDAFGLPVGYSDHTLGYEMAVAAVALGARSVEKHFTLDKNFPGPDHKSSLEPDEFSQMVKAVRNVETAMGDGRKIPTQSEKEMRMKMRRSLVVTGRLPAGHVIRVADLSVKRPGWGIEPKYLDCVVGRSLRKDVEADEPLTWTMV